MAFKMNGPWLKSALKSHPSKELDRLEYELEVFQKQYDKDKNWKTKQDLDHANEALQKYMMNPHDEPS